MSKRGSMFREQPPMNVKRNFFDLSHEVKMSAKFAYLYPVLCKEVLPGETWRNNSTLFARFAPMLAPILHRVDLWVHSFFVPTRIICEPWPDFITGGQQGTTVKTLPYWTPAGLGTATGLDNPSQLQTGSLLDYLGFPSMPDLPPDDLSTEQFSILPIRAYQKIWNDWFRDPTFDTELVLNPELEGNVTAVSYAAGLFNLKSRGWEKDYFTAALPWAQRGVEVLMPISATGSVTYNPYSIVGPDTVADGDIKVKSVGLENRLADSANADIRIENIASVLVDNAQTSINDLRRSIAIQTWLENNARGGARYNDQIRSHFDTIVPDFRLQRAEYLGGGKQPLIISEVVSTAESEAGPLGEIAGHGISAGKTNSFGYRSSEHGFIISVLSVLPRTAYSQGVERMWTRTDKFEFAWRELANIGEQAIKNKEVYFSFDENEKDEDNDDFGYIPRYSEYKFAQDRIAGDFKTTLGFWHLGRNFTVRPALGSNFTTMLEDGGAESSIEETFRRIFAVQDNTDYIWIQMYHKLSAMRPLPYFGVPKF